MSGKIMTRMTRSRTLSDSGSAVSRKVYAPILRRTVKKPEVPVSPPESLSGQSSLGDELPLSPCVVSDNATFTDLLGEGISGIVFAAAYKDPSTGCTVQSSAFKKFKDYSEFESEMEIMSHVRKCPENFRPFLSCLTAYTDHGPDFCGFFMDRANVDFYTLFREGIWDYKVAAKYNIGTWIYEPQVVFSFLLNALEALQQIKVVHSDIKPANILVYPDRLVLSDFSLSSHESMAETREYVVCSVPFRAPEVQVIWTNEAKPPFYNEGAQTHCCRDWHHPDLARIVDKRSKAINKCLKAAGCQLPHDHAVDVWATASVMLHYLNPKINLVTNCTYCYLQKTMQLSQYAITEGQVMSKLLRGLRFSYIISSHTASITMMKSPAGMALEYLCPAEHTLASKAKEDGRTPPPEDIIKQIRLISRTLAWMFHHEPKERCTPTQALNHAKRIHLQEDSPFAAL